MVNFEQALDELKTRYSIKLVSTSYLGVRASDIVVVSYPRINKVTNKRTNITRLGFIMSSGKTSAGEGIKISSKLNQLLNFVDAEMINGSEFSDIVDKLYNKQLEPDISKFKYVYNGNLVSTSIMDKFKTFNVSEISGNSIYRIDINVQ